MKYSNYFGNERKKAHAQFLNADGQFANFNQYDLNASGVQANPVKSAPWIVSIANTTTVDVSNAVIFDFYTVGASFTVGSLNITSGVAGVSYFKMLNESGTHPREIGITYLRSTTSAQVQVSFQVLTTTGSGQISGHTFAPILRSNDLQTLSSTVDQPYMIDGDTKITISTIYASTTLVMYFFPSTQVNPGWQLAGGNAQPIRQFGNPEVVRPLMIKQ
jgi:hypothetical protein